MIEIDVMYKKKKMMSKRRRQIYRWLGADAISIYYVIHYNKTINIEL